MWSCKRIAVDNHYITNTFCNQPTHTQCNTNRTIIISLCVCIICSNCAHVALTSKSICTCIYKQNNVFHAKRWYNSPPMVPGVVIVVWPSLYINIHTVIHVHVYVHNTRHVYMYMYMYGETCELHCSVNKWVFKIELHFSENMHVHNVMSHVNSNYIMIYAQLMK